jgi:5'-methylthioadenosine phosphorylase
MRFDKLPLVAAVFTTYRLTNKRSEQMHSPFVKASDMLLFGELDGQRMVFLSSHERGRRILTAEIDSCANFMCGNVLL